MRNYLPSSPLAFLGAVTAGGIPEELQTGITQVIVGLAVWITTHFLNKLFNRKK